jgi:hypothetical protein
VTLLLVHLAGLPPAPHLDGKGYDHQTDPNETANAQLLRELTRLIPNPARKGTQP